MQFHFGDRDGLIVALAERHMPQHRCLQQGLYDTMVAEGREDDPRSLVEVLVRPSAEYLSSVTSERAWVKIMADLSSEPELSHGRHARVRTGPAIDVEPRLFE